MKIGHIIKHNKIFFYKNHSQNETGTLVPDLFLLFRKALNDAQASGQQLTFNIL